jgi:hypothetical protein
MPAPNEPLKPDDPPGSFLFPDDQIAEITDQEKRFGKYTLARLPQEKRAAILTLLVDRRPAREIARLVHVHHETVSLVADAHAAELDTAWHSFGKKLRRLNWHLADRLEQNIGSFPIQSIPVAIKLLGETAELLEGRATARIDHTGQPPRISNVEQFEAFLSTLPEKYAAGRIIDAETEPEPADEIHLGAGNPALMDAGRSNETPNDPPADR